MSIMRARRKLRITFICEKNLHLYNHDALKH